MSLRNEDVMARLSLSLSLSLILLILPTYSSRVKSRISSHTFHGIYPVCSPSQVKSIPNPTPKTFPSFQLGTHLENICLIYLRRQSYFPSIVTSPTHFVFFASWISGCLCFAASSWLACLLDFRRLGG